MHDPIRTAMMAADRAHKQYGGARDLGQVFGNIGSMFGTSTPVPLPGAPAYAQPMAAQAPAAPSVGAPMMPQPYTGGANYNAISQLLGMPVGQTAGYTPPTYRPAPVYMTEAQRSRAPTFAGPSPATGVAPFTIGKGDDDVEALPEQRSPAPFNPLDYDYSGQQRGFDWRDAARLATNIATGAILPPVDALNKASNFFGGPTVGDMWTAGRQAPTPLNEITYDPKFQQSQREAGGIYYDPWGGVYTGDQYLNAVGIDSVYQREAQKAYETGTPGSYVDDAGFHIEPPAAPEPEGIGPIDHGYVPDQVSDYGPGYDDAGVYTPPEDPAPAPSGDNYEYEG